MVTLKASPYGLTAIKQARFEKSWASSDFRWVEAASDILGVSWSEQGVLAVGISEGTWKRFLAGKCPINAAAFKAYCQVLGLNWEEVADAADVWDQDSVDWGDAPDVSTFYGRSLELTTINHWIIQEHCRLITLLGMGGMGKTALSVKLAQAVFATEQVKKLIWRSLRNAPTIEDLLADLIQFLSRQQESNAPTHLEARITCLLHYLQTSRCLLILDNAETILQAGHRTGQYRTGYEGYGRLLRCIAETAHQSCLILTSREKPQGLAKFEGEHLPVRSLQLRGLPEATGRELFHLKGTFRATDAEWQSLISRYGGNPLALKIVASTIHDYFDSDISQFLNPAQPGAFLLDDIRDLLQQQFQRLTDLEQDILYWLAINREPISLAELLTDFVAPISQRDFLESLNSLQRRSLIEKSGTHFTQQPVVMEYVTEQMIQKVYQAIAEPDLSVLQFSLQSKSRIFITHALLKATAKDYIRETQAALIIQPIIDRLLGTLGTQENLRDRLSQILCTLRGKPARETGYAAGNVINLLHQAGVDLAKLDCSDLSVWQAYMQEIPLHDVNFSHSDMSRCVFTEMTGNILGVAFSPNGQLLATCDTDCSVRVWEVQSGQLRLICRGHTNWVRFVVFSGDGHTLASCGADGTIKLWNVEDGICIKTLIGHEHEVFAVAYSPDQHHLASASADCTVKLWEIQTGQCCKTLTGHQNWVRSIAFSPDGKTLASSSADHLIKLWDTTSATCFKTLVGHRGWVRSVCFSPDGKVLASASSDRTIKLWDSQSGDCLKTYTGHQSDIYWITFTPAGDWLVSASGDRTVKLWDCASDACVKTLFRVGRTNEICFVAVSSDDRTLAAVSLDQTMQLWDYHNGHCLKSWRGHTDWALPVAFSPMSPLLNHADNTDAILASGSHDKTVKLWNWQTGECLRSLQGHTGFTYGLAFNSDGQMLASANTDGTIRLWQVHTGHCFQILQGHSDWVLTVAFDPGRSAIASGSADQTVKLWDWQTGQCLNTLTGHADKIISLAFHPAGQVLATASHDQTLKIWNSSTGDCLNTLTGHTNRPYAVAFSPDGKTIASGSADQTVKLWNWQTGKCLTTLVGHTNWVFSVAFSPDGKTIASASYDHTIRIWDVKTGECVAICQGHTHLVSSVAFSPVFSSTPLSGAKTIASGSQDQTVRIWNAKTGECDRILIAQRLYEGLKLTEVKGLTSATITTLQFLGAVI